MKQRKKLKYVGRHENGRRTSLCFLIVIGGYPLSVRAQDCADVAGPFLYKADDTVPAIYLRVRSLTWTSARFRCEQLFDAPLASIEGASENEWIRATMIAPTGREGCIGLYVNQPCECPCPGEPCSPQQCDTFCFGWSDGAGSLFRNWQPGEPACCPREVYDGQRGEPRYAYLHPSGGTWNNSIDEVAGTYYTSGECRFLFGVCKRSCGSGDLDCDGASGLLDYVLLRECMTGPGPATLPDACHAIAFRLADVDNDGDVDLSDFAVFQGTFEDE